MVDDLRSIVRLGEEMVDPVPAVIARRTSEARIQAIGRLPDANGLVEVELLKFLNEGNAANIGFLCEAVREE